MNIKFLLLFLVSFILTSYGNTKAQTTVQDNSYMIEYNANSRGMFQQIIVTDSVISVQKDRSNEPIIKSCSKSNWDKLTALLEDLDMKTIPKLKAPTEARFYDGAAIATLKITYKGTDYETPGFDHGTPPKEIEPLVKEILSIAENIE